MNGISIKNLTFVFICISVLILININFYKS